MCTKESFKNKVNKSKDGVRFSKIMESNGKRAVVLVPGSDMKTYKVIIRREGEFTTAECLLQESGSGLSKCKGSITTDSSCYHVMTAIMVVFANKGKTVVFARNRDDAKKISNLGGAVKRIINKNNKGTSQYFVVRGEK